MCSFSASFRERAKMPLVSNAVSAGDQKNSSAEAPPASPATRGGSHADPDAAIHSPQRHSGHAARRVRSHRRADVCAGTSESRNGEAPS